jgi:hypothetical protein
LIATFLTTVNVTADMTAAVLVSRARVTAEAEKLPDVTGATTT